MIPRVRRGKRDMDGGHSHNGKGVESQGGEAG
jgi:hypothetical protein